MRHCEPKTACVGRDEQLFPPREPDAQATKDMAVVLVEFPKENQHHHWWTLLFYSLSWEWLKQPINV